MINAVSALGALAHETRLTLFGALVATGPGGLCAGDLAERADISASGLSFHVANLERAGLVSSRREGRKIIYAPRLETLTELLEFLTLNCCEGHPELCRSLADFGRSEAVS
ncbi:MAG: metalloregulator ArsR/SmtB family transcription factor [Xanthomonadales bacterium]|nr:metalloregulator ArsR/SmtB family transcription factor [Xanthomonadales bacterium]